MECVGWELDGVEWGRAGRQFEEFELGVWAEELIQLGRDWLVALLCELGMVGWWDGGMGSWSSTTVTEVRLDNPRRRWFSGLK